MHVADVTLGGNALRAAERMVVMGALGVSPDRRCAAKLLGISLKTLYNKMHKYDLMPKKGAKDGTSST